MERNEVYKAIDSEREFQDELTASAAVPSMIGDLHVGDTLAAIQYNLSKALEEWYKGSVPHTDTMKYMRRIAALCVKAGETYDMVPRPPHYSLYIRCQKMDTSLTSSELNIVKAAHPHLVTHYFRFLKEQEKNV